MVAIAPELRICLRPFVAFDMKEEYDFSHAKRGPAIPVPPGKSRITLRLDEELVQWFKDQVHASGGGNYQTLINAALREYVEARRRTPTR